MDFSRFSQSGTPIDDFFKRQDSILIEQLRTEQKRAQVRTELSAASGISNPDVLDRLLNLGLTPQTLDALMLIPLVAVAWSDGDADYREREAIMSALDEAGYSKGSDVHSMLEKWLASKPDAHLLTTWTSYMTSLLEGLTPEERKILADKVLGLCRRVAQASGGILGIAGTISRQEMALMKSLNAVFVV